MKYATKTILLSTAILLISFLAGCSRKQYMKVIVRPSNEECDAEFKLLWNIDSVIVGDTSLRGTTLYLLNGKYDYEDKDSNKRFLLTGMFLDNTINSDFADCGTDWEFSDSSFSEVKLKNSIN